ncbi:MAG: D-aminoacylase [Candidatus Aminicenantes bacterium]|nr:D-aminoacylase [Candidatus Aminicenantes bacterium]
MTENLAFSHKNYLTVSLVFFFIFVFFVRAEPPVFDVIILGGTIVDGTGQKIYKADLGIKGDKIAAIGEFTGREANLVIDAKGKIVCPGFIDVHTHCDRGIRAVPTADNYILQGVTTVVGGNCGEHPYPLVKFFHELEGKGISPNFACLAGHNTIRRLIMGHAMNKPDENQLLKMKALIVKEMKAGALGFSTGLSYLPGTYSDTEELVELTSVVAWYDGIYASHIRDQGTKIKEAIEEAIMIGERNGLRVQISHIKLASDDVWKNLELITRPVENAMERGVRIAMDQYPYTATSSGLTSSFPSWCFEGGWGAFRNRIGDIETVGKIKAHIIEQRLSSTKAINKMETIYIARFGPHPEYEGKNIKEILLMKGLEPDVSAGLDLIIDIERAGGASCVFFQMTEKDVEELMRLPYVMHASDGGIQAYGRGVPHPRNYGTFPRIIARYVKEKGILSLEEAVRKMSSFPAEFLELDRRGKIAEGMYADINIIDFENFKDTATYDKPHQYCTGLHWVFVNGIPVVEQGQHTGRRPGHVIYGPGKN